MPNLREVRRDTGLSQEALAERAGISAAAISLIESGKRLPTGHTRARIAEALGMDEVMLFPAISTNRGAAEPQLRACEGGRLLYEARQATKLSQRELAERADVSQATIWNLENDAWGVRPERGGRIAAALERDVDELFEPANGRPSPAGHAKPPAQPRESAQRWERRYAEQKGYLTVGQAATLLVVKERTVLSWAEHGYMVPVETVSRGAHCVRFFTDRAVRACARARYTSTDYRVPWTFDPLKVLKHASKRLPNELAEEMADRALERKKTYARFRPGAGRPPSPGPHAHHLEWAELFRQVMTDLTAAVASAAAMGLPPEPPPTNWEVAKSVAQLDYDAHPDRWPDYSPYELPDAAARRVWNAVKPLLNAVTVIQSA